MTPGMFGYRNSPRRKSAGGRVKLADKGRQALIGTLDRELSYFVRASALLEASFVRCVTCGKPMGDMAEMDCGHYITRAVLATRFDLMNLGCQCQKCNRFSAGLPHIFRKHLIRIHGEEAIDDLEERANGPCFLGNDDLLKQVEHYRTKNRELKKRLGK